MVYLSICMQLRMLMVILYVADGLRVTLTSVEGSVGTSRQILMEEMYVLDSSYHKYCDLIGWKQGF